MTLDDFSAGIAHSPPPHTDVGQAAESLRPDGRRANEADYTVPAKRKRRIEIPRMRNVPPATAGPMREEENAANAHHPDGQQRVGTECEEEMAARQCNNSATTRDVGTSTADDYSRPMNCESGNGSDEDGNGIGSMSELVAEKIKFLSEGRPAVTGVQAMAIQLEVSVKRREWAGEKRQFDYMPGSGNCFYYFSFHWELGFP